MRETETDQSWLEEGGEALPAEQHGALSGVRELRWTLSVLRVMWLYTFVKNHNFILKGWILLYISYTLVFLKWRKNT